MDPQKTDDGQPYGPIRYKNIVQERYIITKNSGISYEDTGKMTPTERQLYLDFIAEEFERTKQAIEKAKEESRQNSSRSRRR